MGNTGDARGCSFRITAAFAAFGSVLGVACTNGGANVGSTRSDEGGLVRDGGAASVEGFAWLVQLGTAGVDQARGIAANADGVYVLGHSRRASEDLGGTSSSGTSPSGGGESFDVWVRQLALSGELGWERWIGSAQDDQAGGIALDGNGNLYVVGRTEGALGSRTLGSDASGSDASGSDASGSDALGAPDAFVTKLDASGDVVWTLQLGAADGASWASAVSVDGAGDVYVAGSTAGTLGERHVGADDVFVLKLSPDGEALWTTQLGTPEIDRAHGIATDALGNPYVAGETRGTLGQSNAGDADSFVSGLGPDGTLLWTQQLGTAGHDYAAAVAVSVTDGVRVTGGGQATRAPLDGGASDGFVYQLDTSGDFEWTESFREAEDVDIRALATDSGSNAYVAGNTGATLGELSAGRLDGFVRKYAIAGDVEWTQQFGTEFDDGVHALAVGPAGTVFVAGNTDGSFGGEARGGLEVFVGALGR